MCILKAGPSMGPNPVTGKGIGFLCHFYSTSVRFLDFARVLTACWEGGLVPVFRSI